jgi:RHS repeat-associated protein
MLSGDGATFAYDANGNTVSKVNGNETTTYGYNSADRLEKVLLPDGTTVAYVYDPFGRRIKKDVAGTVTYFLYSDEGLIGEYDASGNQQKGYGWKLDGIWGTDPVFMVENGSYYFYQNDHLGTPQKLTDESENVVWSAEYTAFGEAIVDPASTVENNLRFPGQYFDEETGLHNNWNRYYDPTLGRYSQVDPLRFDAGDTNIYRYVENNPLAFFDVDGLRMCDISPEQGFWVVKDAESWRNTPYKYVGAKSSRHGADCSGSTARIFEDIGIEFVYFSTRDTNSSKFKKYYRRLAPNEAPRAGDVVIWPGQHMVIYAPNIYGKDPWGHRADALGAFGAHIRMHGVRRNVGYGPASIAHTHKKHPYYFYRRQVECPD